MAKNTNEDEKRAAIREAKREGVAPSAAGATTGASKQIDHATHGENRHEHGGSSGPGKS